MKSEDKKKDTQETRNHNEKMPIQKKDEAAKKGFPGYPHYPPSEDIFNNEEEVDLDTEKILGDANKTDKPKK